MLAALTANINRDPKKRKKEYKWYDFMPQWAEVCRKAEKKSPEELKKIFERSLVPHFNAVAKGKNK